MQQRMRVSKLKLLKDKSGLKAAFFLIYRKKDRTIAIKKTNLINDQSDIV
ncbi:hypothetical protein SAMN04488519_102297 [Algoriphagus ornithinivorans]|uniref:Uncharacterized protein n=1 Tax=Algoriphagus ornithinivorans TaxID=226506 RepID=A0A1I5CJK9_9BACT|nr:hypothetical protein SAMN04488519_102297 [Algoriphagus ornithinivorans]